MPAFIDLDDSNPRIQLEVLASGNLPEPPSLLDSPPPPSPSLSSLPMLD